YFGWQRSAYGEQPPRALPVLAVMTGNIGLAGGGPGLIPTEPGIPIGFLPTGQNPVKAAIPTFKWTEAIERGVEFDFKHDGLKGVDKLSTNLKFIWNYAGNALVNQHADCGRTAKLLRDTKKCEFIVTIDNFLTPSARFSDIVLPETTHFEREDIVSIYTFGGHAIYLNKVVEPMYECRNLYDICADIAGRLGFKEAFTEGKTQEQWVEELCRQAEKLDPNFHFEEFKRTGIYKIDRKPVVAYADFIKDPDKNPLKTPSGKIEIFVKDFYDFGNPKEVPAIPKYISAWEGPEDPLREKYPLQCIGFHYKRRAHSTFDNIAWLDEAGPQVVWINPKDAQARGIKNGDQVKVFNDRGTIIMPAKVTPRIMPGVVAIPQGAWYSPDANGVDHRGCINVITTWRPTPLAKGNPQHTNLVEIHKA
ncbi:MAG: molybdopterin-dependent oxidoreductase, partial [Clostridia bacterium]|nr:molybdopterin-dependent oxidoreductase [Clostridia bacterium]